MSDRFTLERRTGEQARVSGRIDVGNAAQALAAGEPNEEINDLDGLGSGIYPVVLQQDSGKPGVERSGGTETCDPHLAARRHAIALDGLYGAGLAGTVGSRQHDDLARVDLEIHSIDSNEVAITNGQAVDGDNRHRAQSYCVGRHAVA